MSVRFGKKVSVRQHSLILLATLFLLTGIMSMFMLKTINLPTKQRNSPEYVVPNKVHYIWFSEKEHILKFREYLSILSVHKIQKPDGIYFHTNYAPSGHYWNKLLQFPEFHTVHRERPRIVFGVNIEKEAFETSDSDITRVKILMEEGGIYLDTDVWVLKSLDLLRKFECVLGSEGSKSNGPSKIILTNSVIVASNSSAFLRLWMEHYLFDYQYQKWGHNFCVVPTKLAKQYPDLIHIEKKTLLHPSWYQPVYLYGSKIYPWRDNYVLHLWRKTEQDRKNSKYNYNITEENVWSLNSTVGQAARYILSK